MDAEGGEKAQAAQRSPYSDVQQPQPRMYNEPPESPFGDRETSPYQDSPDYVTPKGGQGGRGYYDDNVEMTGYAR